MRRTTAAYSIGSGLALVVTLILACAILSPREPTPVFGTLLLGFSPSALVLALARRPTRSREGYPRRALHSLVRHPFGLELLVSVRSGITRRTHGILLVSILAFWAITPLY